MATVGCLIKTGVPIFGLPNTITVAGGIFSPNSFAAAAWSSLVKSLSPFSLTAFSNFSIVCLTECLLFTVIRPFASGVAAACRLGIASNIVIRILIISMSFNNHLS